MTAKYVTVRLSQLSLDPSNPRFDPVTDEATALEELCDSEDMIAIGDDIVSFGLNPLELIGIVPTSGRPGKAGQHYVVHEGNRRVGAMKMIADPRLAPPQYQAGFRRLDAAKLPPDIRAVEFSTKTDLEHWIKLLHQRDSNPAGRNSWNPEQQARAFGTTRNKRIVDLLDIAERAGWIKRKDRRGKVSTLHRFVSNPKFRAHAGFDYTTGSDDLVIRDQVTFDREVKALIDDMLAGKVNTRFDKRAIDDWITQRKTAAATPGGSGGSSTKSGQPPGGGAGGAPGGGGGAGGAPGGSGGQKPKPTPPKKPELLPYDKSIAEELEKLASQKLTAFYHSICDVSLEHTPLLTVGCWSFLETLCAIQQNAPTKGFNQVWNNNFLEQKLGFQDANRRKELIAAIGRLYSDGNITKHAMSGAWMNDKQLYNDMDTLRPVILRVVQLVNGSHAPGNPWP